MRVLFDWLKEFVDITISPEEAAHTLTMIGLEIEGMEKIDGDVVFEVNVTPNRPDCLNMLGIARELSAALNIPLKLPKYKFTEEGSDDGFKVEIISPDLCSRYAGRVIKGVKIGQSPDWIRQRLTKCGIRTINNIVDITNYVLLEFGHPLHAFDLSTLHKKTIRVDIAGDGNDITTLDEVERKLPSDTLLIWDAKNPVAIAGIMGGADTEVTDSTKDVFLESAFFEPGSIRRSSKALGLKSEAAYRFERGADMEFLSCALDRAASLMQKIAGGRIYKTVDAYPKKFVPASIEVRHERVNRVLGTDIPNNVMTDIIRRLGIGLDEGKQSFTVRPPSFRLDIKREEDVIEEIARIYGYDRIKTTIPRAVISGGNADRRRMLVLRIKDFIRKFGFNEAINFSFMNDADLDMLDIASDDRRRKAIVIRNPLRKEEALLRTTLVPSLVNDFVHNFSRGVREISIFEESRVFEDIGRPLPLEISRLGGIYYREKMPSLWKEDASGFYIVKGVIEAVFEDLHIKGYSFSGSSEPFLHPGQSAEIRVSGMNIGFMGLLSPKVAGRLDLKVTKPEIIVFEMDIDKLISVIPVSLEYSPIPKFPSVDRDIAIIVDEQLKSSEAANLIRAYPSELIDEVSIFDLYRGKNIPEGKKSLAFTVRYRSQHRTLTEAEVEETHSAVIKHLLSETGGELRA